MPGKYKTVLVVIVAIVLWFYFLNKNDPVNKINVVSFESSSNSQINSHKTKHGDSKLSNVTQPIQFKDPLSQQSTHNKPELSYMELYKKLLLAEDCYLIYSEDDRIDPSIDIKSIERSSYHLKKYQENIAINTNYRQQEATTIQVEYFKEYIVECNQLKDEVIQYFAKDESQLRPLYLIDENIRKKMDETKPITEEEIDLKRTLKLVSDFKANSSFLLELKNGKYTKSEKYIHKLESLIRKYTRDLNDSKYYGKEAKKSIEYQKLLEQLNIAQETLSSFRILDEKKIAMINESVSSLLNELQLNLSTEYPTVFVESFKALNFAPTYTLPSEYLLYNLTETYVVLEIISQQIYSDLPLKNKQYFNSLLGSAVNLYLCYLGEDCKSINNRTKKRLCFIPKRFFDFDHEGIFYEACYLDLEEFFLQNYLTENQVEDMNILFNYMINTYAK